MIIKILFRGQRGRLPGAPGHPNQCSGHLSQCFNPNPHSLLQPRLPTPAVSGAHVWAEWRHHPCLLEGPQHGDRKWGKGPKPPIPPSTPNICGPLLALWVHILVPSPPSHPFSPVQRPGVPWPTQPKALWEAGLFLRTAIFLFFVKDSP